MKKLIIGIALLVGTAAQAEVADVGLWEAYPGRGAELMAVAQEARAIQAKLGMDIYIGVDQRGLLHFAAGADTWENWGKAQAALAQHAEMQALIEKFQADPPARQVESFHVFTPMAAEVRGVSVVYSWDVLPGRTQDFLESAQQAAAIQSKLGASVGMHIDDLGDVHYEVTFDSWAAWGRYDAALAASEEWNAFFSDAMENPTGTLVKVYRVDAVP
jgi:hypothetical protein